MPAIASLSPIDFAWIAALLLIGLPAAFALACWLLGLRYVPHDKVGVLERLWSPSGSLREGAIVATAGEAGFQAELLRGGVHAWYPPFQYRVHRVPLVVVAEGRIGYVYARDGRPLAPNQTLGESVPCNDFQDARAFLAKGGRRGRQRAILREGVFAINTALFVVITEDAVHAGPLDVEERRVYAEWQRELAQRDGFAPVLIGHGGARVERTPGVGLPSLEPSSADTLGIVTIQDGPTLASGEIIAPEVRPAGEARGHDYFQDPERFLELGGRRGKQLQVLTDGTYFVNRWFASVEFERKTLVPIGFVGVVVSYFGGRGTDVTGQGFRYGEQVEEGQRGVWRRALPPGKYPLNPYAMKVELVPTTNFVLRWITGEVGAHQYDRDLTSIRLITADGYEPVLPLSLVLHIDYEKAPSVIQRFGDVQRLISQTLDPILTSYFRDVAQSTCMLDLLTRREEIQQHATAELGRRFAHYDINCIAVLIGRPESHQREDAHDPIDRLFEQLRERRLAEEQKATYRKQEEAAQGRKQLEDAQATAAQQAELTQTRIAIEIEANRGEAELARSRRLAERDVALAEGQSRADELLGRGEAARTAQVGLAEAAVFLNKIRAYGDARLFALALGLEKLAHSAQPLVPERLFVSQGAGAEGSATAPGGPLGQLLSLLLAERAGVAPSDAGGAGELEAFARGLAERYGPPPGAPCAPAAPAPAA